jgi:hypothetical protein
LSEVDYLSGIWLASMVDPECLWYWREKKLVLAEAVGELSWSFAKCPEPYWRTLVGGN